MLYTEKKILTENQKPLQVTVFTKKYYWLVFDRNKLNETWKNMSGSTLHDMARITRLCYFTKNCNE